MAVDGNGNVVLTAKALDNIDLGGGTLTGGGVVIGKYLGSDGAHVWSTAFGNYFRSLSKDIAIDSNGDFIVTGRLQNPEMEGRGIFVSKFSGLTGALVWTEYAGLEAFSDIGNGVAVDSNGDIVVTGGSRTSTDFGGGTLPNAGLWDIFLVRLREY